MRQYLAPVFALALVATPARSAESDLLSAFAALQGHVNGTAPLSPAQIETNKLVLDANKSIFGNSTATITAGFNLVQAYEATYGPMWSVGSPTANGFTRNATSNQDIHWTMFNAMQYIVDDTYNAANISSLSGTLNGLKFGSADVVPGYVNPAVNPNTSFSVAIDGSFPDDYGRNTMHWAEADRNARNATGAYLTPGTLATVTVPASLVNAGYKIRVGGQSWDFSNKNPVDRLDRVSLVLDINSTTMQIVSPLGGSIYIETPFEGNAGVVNIDFTNVAHAPFFSMQDHHTTTLSEWQTTQRNYAAPWTDLQSEKFMMTVPTGWVYALDDPVTLMENWDKAMDVTNDLMGFPRDRGKATLYEAVDVRIRSGAYAPGYPTVNSTYEAERNQDASDWNPAGNAYGGYQNHYLVRGPGTDGGTSVLFHELGHAYLFPKLPGETEAIVNLLHVAVMNQAFGQDIQTAFRTSRTGYNSSFYTTDTTAIQWMTSFNFFYFKEPMHQLEKQYQLKGHAKFVEVARVFGWDVLGDYYKTFNDDFEALGTTPNYDIDDHLTRLSKAIGEDITPLFHFWGVQPLNLVQIEADLDAAGVVKSHAVFDLLKHYRSLVPEDNAQFRQHVSTWWGHQPLITGYWTEHEHARQWDSTDLSGEPYGEGAQYSRTTDLPNGEMYTEASADLIRQVINELLAMYYLDFLADLNADQTLDTADWLIFIANAQVDMTGLTTEQSLALGDLDGDLDNDIDDFDLFRRAYEIAHPEPGAFQQMLAEAAVPEPATGLVLAFAAIGCATRRRRRD